MPSTRVRPGYPGSGYNSRLSYRRNNHDGLRVAGVVLWCLLCLAGAIYFDVFWFLIGGITQAVHGAEATPTNTSELAWGILRALCTGFGFFVAFLAALVGGQLILGGIRNG